MLCFIFKFYLVDLGKKELLLVEGIIMTKTTRLMY